MEAPNFAEMNAPAAPAASAKAALAGFHPAVAAWFEATFEAPTRVQVEGWPSVLPAQAPEGGPRRSDQVQRTSNEHHVVGNLPLGCLARVESEQFIASHLAARLLQWVA